MWSKQSITETIIALLVFLFLYTGISKYMDYTNFKDVLSHIPLFGKFANFIALALPGFEIILVVLLAIPKTRLWGLWLTGVTLSVFTIYLVYMIMYAPKLPCSCGGVISKLSWKSHIYFNLFFVLLSSIGIKLQRDLFKKRLEGNNQLAV